MKFTFFIFISVLILCNQTLPALEQSPEDWIHVQAPTETNENPSWIKQAISALNTLKDNLTRPSAHEQARQKFQTKLARQKWNRDIHDPKSFDIVDKNEAKELEIQHTQFLDDQTSTKRNLKESFTAEQVQDFLERLIIHFHDPLSLKKDEQEVLNNPLIEKKWDIKHLLLSDSDLIPADMKPTIRTMLNNPTYKKLFNDFKMTLINAKEKVIELQKAEETKNLQTNLLTSQEKKFNDLLNQRITELNALKTTENLEHTKLLQNAQLQLLKAEEAAKRTTLEKNVTDAQAVHTQTLEMLNAKTAASLKSKERDIQQEKFAKQQARILEEEENMRTLYNDQENMHRQFLKTDKIANQL